MAGLPKSGVILVAEDAPSFMATLNAANRAVTGFADQGDQAGGRFSHGFGQIVTGALREVGAQLVNFAAEGGKALAGFIKDSIGVAADFEQTMNVLQATSGATGDLVSGELGQVAKKAKELGADLTLPATSAVDAGEAMLELSKAGFTVQQSMDAAKGVLQLSAAAQIGNAQAAEIASNAINAFHLSANDAVFVSDLLAASANASSVEITDVAKSYQMAGAVFANFQGPVVGSHQAIIDLTTAVGLLGNAGIKGSDAGTSLKQALLQLTGPSDKAKGMMQQLAASIGVSGDIAYDAQGKMRSFPEILGLTARATKNLTDEQRNQYITDIFGADASRAILILMQQGPDAWAKMEAAVTKEGAAKELAAAQTKGFKGALEGAKSQLETLQLTLGEKFLPLLASFVNNYISPGIAALNNFASALFGDKEALDLLPVPLQSIARWVNSVIAAFGYWQKGVISTRTALNVVSESLGRFAPIVDRVLEVMGFLSNNFQTVFSLISGGTPGIFNLAGLIADLGKTFGLTAGQAAGIIGIFQKIGDVVQIVIGGAIDTLKGRWEAIWSTITTIANGIWSVVSAVFGQVQTFLQSHGTDIETVIRTAWNTINNTINGTIRTIGTVVGAGLQAIAGWINTHSAEIQGTLNTAWNTIRTVVTTVTTTVQGIVTVVFGAIAGFLAAHGTEIQTAISTAWNTIQSIITLVTQIIQATIGAWGKSINSDVTGNTRALTTIISGAWTVISSIIQGALTIIQGILQIALGAIKGDWQMGWEGVKTIASGVWTAISGIISGVLEVIAGAMGTSMEKIGRVWKGNWDMLVSIVAKVVDLLADVGGKIVSNIANGFANAWSGFIKTVESKLSELKDMLPFSEPKDPHSPLYGLGNAGKAIVRNIQQGINESPPLTPPLLGTGETSGATYLQGLSGLPSANYVSPPAQSSQMPCNCANPITNSKTINMPIYTNNSPAALQSSWAILNASMP